MGVGEKTGEGWQSRWREGGVSGGKHLEINAAHDTVLLVGAGLKLRLFPLLPALSRPFRLGRGRGPAAALAAWVIDGYQVVEESLVELLHPHPAPHILIPAICLPPHAHTNHMQKLMHHHSQ